MHHLAPPLPIRRLVFNRKNKTLRAGLTTDSVLTVLEANMKTVASLTGSAPPVGGLPGVKAVVEGVLTALHVSDKRGSKMDIDDFMQLLAAMNAAGIHFHA